MPSIDKIPAPPPPVSFKHSTSKALWEDLYRVSIPTRQMTPIEHQRLVGTRSSGVPEIDRALANERTITWITIDQMVELYREGVLIGLLDHADSKKIYEAIKPHLDTWVRMVHRGVNVGSAPYEDLILLDKFAAAVYKHARHQVHNEYLNDGFAFNMMNAGISALNFFKDRPMLQNKSKTAYELGRVRNGSDVANSEHESMADILKRQAVSLRS